MNANGAPTYPHNSGNDDIKIGLWVYCIQAAGIVFTPLMLVALAINLLKRKDVTGTVLQTHFDWQIRTFIWSLIWIVVSFLVPKVGWIIIMAMALWLMYRICRGVINLSKRQAMYGR